MRTCVLNMKVSDARLDIFLFDIGCDDIVYSYEQFVWICDVYAMRW